AREGGAMDVPQVLASPQVGVPSSVWKGVQSEREFLVAVPLKAVPLTVRAHRARHRRSSAYRSRQGGATDARMLDLERATLRYQKDRRTHLREPLRIPAAAEQGSSQMMRAVGVHPGDHWALVRTELFRKPAR